MEAVPYAHPAWEIAARVKKQQERVHIERAL